MRAADENEPRDAVAHWVGEGLDTLSVEELSARIALLRSEIARLEAARDAKKAAVARAESIFRL